MSETFAAVFGLILLAYRPQLRRACAGTSGDGVSHAAASDGKPRASRRPGAGCFSAAVPRAAELSRRGAGDDVSLSDGGERGEGWVEATAGGGAVAGVDFGRDERMGRPAAA